MTSGAVKHELADLTASVRERFQAARRVLSFDEYLEVFHEAPLRHSRDAPRYLLNCFDHYGEYEETRPWGTMRRFRLFDGDWNVDEGALPPSSAQRRLVGQELIQEAFYRALKGFEKQGRLDRLILLHGPNGSAKSTFFESLMRGLERYSHTAEGALYRFSWIFPRGTDGKSIGFGPSSGGASSPGGGLAGSYAHLAGDQIDAKLPSEIREHPLHLLPIDERRRLLARAGELKRAPAWLTEGDLSHKNRQIYEALLTAYQGDLTQVLAHVQVERYYISRRYRVGAVTIGPQMAVDARERQVTADRSHGALPAALSSLALYKSYDELVDAAGGILEYSDLLKRPLDAWKYLLLAIENSEVALPQSNMSVNTVLVASSNEVHLSAFKEHHEYNSFRGRLSLVRVPYLVDYTQEQAIYDEQIVPQMRVHVAPHTTNVAALWAVLTRLRRPQGEHFPGALGPIAADLTPKEKADLYAEGTVPGRLSPEEARELRPSIELLYREFDDHAEYEGLTGASPREIRSILLSAAGDEEECLTPMAVLSRIEAFCRRTDFDFLKQTPDRGYYEHAKFVSEVREHWLDRVDEELRRATGLVEEEQYRDLFTQYVTHVSFWSKKEKLENRVTGKSEDPDADLMRTVEQKLGIDESGHEVFRHNLISAVAAQAIDHPDAELDYVAIFPRYIQQLRDSYYAEKSGEVGAIAADILTLLSEGISGRARAVNPDADNRTGMNAVEREQAEDALNAFYKRGYQASSARLVLSELVDARYQS